MTSSWLSRQLLLKTAARWCSQREPDSPPASAYNKNERRRREKTSEFINQSMAGAMARSHMGHLRQRGNPFLFSELVWQDKFGLCEVGSGLMSDSEQFRSV